MTRKKNPLVSVVVCTYNGSKTIKKTLNSLNNQSLSKKKYEIIVIDNASSDSTPEIVKKFTKKYSNFHYVPEPKQGLSQARNRGLKESKGKYIAFIDDDAIASKDWLKNIIKAFKKYDYDAIAGDIEAVWPKNKPKWLNEILQGYWAVHNYGRKPKELNYPQEYPCGVNMAFKKTILGKVGGFSLSLGRTGESLLSREETELCYRIEKNEGKIGYAPGLSVKHIISPKKMSIKWLFRRACWEGKSEAIMETMHFKKKKILNKTKNQKLIKNIIGVFTTLLRKKPSLGIYKATLVVKSYCYSKSVKQVNRENKRW